MWHSLVAAGKHFSDHRILSAQLATRPALVSSALQPFRFRQAIALHLSELCR